MAQSSKDTSREQLKEKRDKRGSGGGGGGDGVHLLRMPLKSINILLHFQSRRYLRGLQYKANVSAPHGKEISLHQGMKNSIL